LSDNKASNTHLKRIMINQSFTTMASMGQVRSLVRSRSLVVRAPTLDSPFGIANQRTFFSHLRPKRRYFSDKMLGYSPMAPATPLSNQESHIPTKEDVSVAGGVWNPTSAKRDKLGELKIELTEDQDSLDDAATDEQKLDLYLADGVQWIAHTVDQTRLGNFSDLKKECLVGKCTSTNGGGPAVTETKFPLGLDPTEWEVQESLLIMEAWIKEQEQSIQSTIPDLNLQKEHWDTYLSETIQKINELLATLPAARCLRHVRDFYSVSQESISSQALSKEEAQQHLQDLAVDGKQAELTSAGIKCLARYRLLLTRATCEQLRESWETLTALSDQALDRLAVNMGDEDTSSGSNADGIIPTVSLQKLNMVLKACLMSNASDRVDAWWKIVDQDCDGLLEKSDMEQVASLVVKSVQSAILILFEEALDASPIRGSISQSDTAGGKKNSEPKNEGWRERRRESKAKKGLVKAFQRAVNNHFEDEVEMPHRLRCIYAWAEKAHQDNRVDSVLIEASGWSGRTRYVELQPKISLPEFRKVQKVHFTHLDRVGFSITNSVREELWVDQGKGRQSAELKRDCLTFLLVVSIFDYGIIIL